MAPNRWHRLTFAELSVQSQTRLLDDDRKWFSIADGSEEDRQAKCMEVVSVLLDTRQHEDFVRRSIQWHLFKEEGNWGHHKTYLAYVEALAVHTGARGCCKREMDRTAACGRLYMALNVLGYTQVPAKKECCLALEKALRLKGPDIMGQVWERCLMTSSHTPSIGAPDVRRAFLAIVGEHLCPNPRQRRKVLRTRLADRRTPPPESDHRPSAATVRVEAERRTTARSIPYSDRLNIQARCVSQFCDAVTVATASQDKKWLDDHAEQLTIFARMADGLTLLE